MWGCLCVSGCKGHCPLHSFSSWDTSSSESQVFCTPCFIDLSLLVFWCTYIAKHFKRSLPSWLSNLVESMFLCIHKKIIKWKKYKKLTQSLQFWMQTKNIIWSESNDILTKKWKKYKKLNPSLQFWMQTKILEVTHALPKYTVVLSLHILLVWADLHVSWFSGDYPLCSFSC